MNANADVQVPDLQTSVEQYLAYITNVRRCSKNTAIAYGHDLRGLLEFCDEQGVSSPTQVTSITLETYLSRLTSLSANTIRRRAHAFSSWLEYCLRRRWLPVNPARDLQLPRRARRERRYPSQTQVEALLAAARTPIEKAAIWLLVTTGVRRRELLDLDLSSLSANGSEIRVLGKGDAERRIPLADATRQVLHEYVAIRGLEPGPLLLSRVNTRIGVTRLRRLFLRLLKRADLQDEGFTLHSMRHAFATHLLRSGADIATVSRLLGHLSLEVTSVYTHSDPMICRAAVNNLPFIPAGGEHGE